tara:strand:+ start:1516 stop:1698 length:183 start_codon:yes stop_codon:yes gene_type:complete
MDELMRYPALLPVIRQWFNIYKFSAGFNAKRCFDMSTFYVDEEVVPSCNMMMPARDARAG